MTAVVARKTATAANAVMARAHNITVFHQSALWPNIELSLFTGKPAIKPVQPKPRYFGAPARGGGALFLKTMRFSVEVADGQPVRQIRLSPSSGPSWRSSSGAVRKLSARSARRPGRQRQSSNWCAGRFCIPACWPAPRRPLSCMSRAAAASPAIAACLRLRNESSGFSGVPREWQGRSEPNGPAHRASRTLDGRSPRAEICRCGAHAATHLSVAAVQEARKERKAGPRIRAFGFPARASNE